MADNYTDQFLAMHKKNLEIDEANRKAGEEALQKRQQEQQHQAKIAAKAPQLWHEVRQLMQTKVAEMNQRDASAQMRITNTNGDELQFHYRNQVVLMKYRRDLHYVHLGAIIHGKTKGDVTYVPVVVGDDVKFSADKQPVEFDAFWNTVLKLFVEFGTKV